MRRNLRAHSPDYVLVIAVFFLTIFGLIVLSSASSEIGRASFDDSYFYLKHQILNGLLIGVVGFFVAYKVPLAYLKKAATVLLFLTIVGLILVFTPVGFSSGGASRWISIAGVTIQPAEILKLTFVLYLAAWLSSDIRKRSSLMEGFVPFLTICGSVAVLLFLQPTTSTAVIILAGSLIMYFISGEKISFVISAIVLGIIALVLIVYFTPYRLERVLSYLDPARDPLGSGFQGNQALIALGSGGMFGVGYGNSISKFTHLPEPISDSIFAIIGEEFGFVGSVLLLSVLLVLIMRMFRVAVRSPDTFTKLIIVGIVSIVGIQSFVNISAISGLLPITGVPLPFISFGGTALAVLLTSMGLVTNISRYTL